MNFKPIGDRILVKAIKESVSGAIIIPDEVETSQTKGEVIAVSDSVKEMGELEVGMIVMFESISVDITLEGADYKLVHHEYVQGILS